LPCATQRRTSVSRAVSLLFIVCGRRNTVFRVRWHIHRRTGRSRP
jgi:hypothetical protein